MTCRDLIEAHRGYNPRTRRALTVADAIAALQLSGKSFDLPYAKALAAYCLGLSHTRPTFPK
jgi:hypothetical protein